MNIYVAGPFTADPVYWTEFASQVGYNLMLAGHNAHVPHMATGAWHDSALDYEDYMKLDLSIIELWADALVYLAPSPGADREREAAHKLDLIVIEHHWDWDDHFPDIDNPYELPEYAN